MADARSDSPFRAGGFLERFLDALVTGASAPGDPIPDSVLDAAGLARWVSAQQTHLEWLYEGLDDEARDLMVRLFTHAALGNGRVTLPLGGVVGRSATEVAESLAGPETPAWRGMRRFDLAPVAIPVSVDADLDDVVGSLLLVQHRSPFLHHVAPQAGDVAIDATAGVGTATLQLATAVGAWGHVLSFQPDETLRELLVANLALNFGLADRVRIVPSRPGMRIDAGDAATVAIDDLVEDGLVPRVDFLRIALDGGELEALVGAARTLQRYRPRLAVWLRLASDDWIAVPRLLDGLGLGYRFSLGHTFGEHPQPILFAWAAPADDG